MDIVERLAQWAENDMKAEAIALEAKYEIERLRNDLRLVIMTDNEYCKGLGEDTKRLWEALKGLLQCPAIADGNHNEPAWYDPETAMAEKKARAALKEGE